MGYNEQDSYDVKKFKDTAFAVQYGADVLGATEGPPSIKPEITTEDIVCNQSQGRVIKKLVKKISYVITVQFMQPDTVLDKVFGLSTYTTADLGTDLLDTTNVKDLVLTAIGTKNTDVYTFHACTAIVTAYDLDGEKLHNVEVEFRTSDNGDATGKILTVNGSGTGGGGGDDPDPDPDPDNGGGDDGE